MPAVSSFFLILALGFAVVIGPQTRAWSWGPAMIALGLSVATSLPALWRRNRSGAADLGLLALASGVAGWFAWRAWVSPVHEYGNADFLLLCGAVSAFFAIRSVIGNLLAERILVWGTAVLLLLSVIVVVKQVIDPNFSPLFSLRATQFPSGFYAHYNEAANYFIASSFIVAAAALTKKEKFWVKIIWGAIAFSGLIAAYLTKSRGGILGVGMGSVLFVSLTLIIGFRYDSKWFSRGLIAIPIIGIILVYYLLTGWQNSQEARSQLTDLSTILDNNIRLYFLGLATSCFADHPLTGGGSRSFSWECYQHWDSKIYGQGGARPEFVHNELIQAATDYGLIGLIFILILLGLTVTIGLIHVFLSKKCDDSYNSDTWIIGGVSGLAGMLVQSSFSFVFHLMPGVLLLGICLGSISISNSSRYSNSHFPIVIKSLVSSILIFFAFSLFSNGYLGTKLTHILWPVYFKNPSKPNDQIILKNLEESIKIWPQAELLKTKAELTMAQIDSTSPKITIINTIEKSLSAYAQAAKLNPFDPGIAINRANLLSFASRDEEAEMLYRKAIVLQGGLEPGFKSHLAYAKHLLVKATRQYSQGDLNEAIITLTTGVEHIEIAAKAIPPWAFSATGNDTRLSIHEALGVAREANGDFKGALTTYEFASTLRNGGKVQYRIAALMGKMAANSWAERRASEAMAYFIEAKRRAQMSTDLPSGVTLSQRVEYIDYLDKTIGFLKAAKIEASALPQN